MSAAEIEEQLFKHLKEAGQTTFASYADLVNERSKLRGNKS